MRHAFQPLPGMAGRPRPVIDLVLDGLEVAPQACLVDTGATSIRMSAEIAEIAGIGLDDIRAMEVLVAGGRVDARPATVTLTLPAGQTPFTWEAIVHFCEPWPFAFGLFGLSGLDHFLLTVNAYDEWTQLTVNAGAG